MSNKEPNSYGFLRALFGHPVTIVTSSYKLKGILKDIDEETLLIELTERPKHMTWIEVGEEFLVFKNRVEFIITPKV